LCGNNRFECLKSIIILGVWDTLVIINFGTKMFFMAHTKKYEKGTWDMFHYNFKKIFVLKLINWKWYLTVFVLKTVLILDF
jgi:hypothetical protein